MAPPRDEALAGFVFGGLRQRGHAHAVRADGRREQQRSLVRVHPGHRGVRGNLRHRGHRAGPPRLENRAHGEKRLPRPCRAAHGGHAAAPPPPRLPARQRSHPLRGERRQLHVLRHVHVDHRRRCVRTLSAREGAHVRHRACRLGLGAAARLAARAFRTASRGTVGRDGVSPSMLLAAAVLLLASNAVFTESDLVKPWISFRSPASGAFARSACGS